jgi:hypothetical protein
MLDRTGAAVKIGKDSSGDWTIVKAKPKRKGLVINKYGKVTTGAPKTPR